MVSATSEETSTGEEKGEGVSVREGVRGSVREFSRRLWLQGVFHSDLVSILKGPIQHIRSQPRVHQRTPHSGRPLLCLSLYSGLCTHCILQLHSSIPFTNRIASPSARQKTVQRCCSFLLVRLPLLCVVKQVSLKLPWLHIKDQLT